MDWDQKIEVWIERIDGVTNSFTRLMERISEAQLHIRPREGAWSIAEVMEHLIKVNRSYEPEFAQLSNKSYPTGFFGKIRFFRKWIEKSILRTVKPTYRRKTTTMPIWTPVNNDVESEILEEFIAMQEDLKKMIRDSKPYLVAKRKIASPANSQIVYSLAGAWDIITYHELRHLDQAKRVADTLLSKD